MAQQVIAIQQVYLVEGWHIFHFDGSAKHYPKAGWVGGFGSCRQGHWEFSSPLVTLENQTNNRAELKAAISPVVKVPQKTVIFRDSTYVLVGVADKAYTWRRLQWCLPTGPVPNLDLWEALPLAIDMAQHTIRWAWSPLHQGIPGNERADALAEKGRQNHPLLTYPSPQKQDISHTPSQAAPIKGRAQRLIGCDSDVEATVAMTLFKTPSQASSDDQETYHFPTPCTFWCGIDTGCTPPFCESLPPSGLEGVGTRTDV